MQLASAVTWLRWFALTGLVTVLGLGAPVPTGVAIATPVSAATSQAGDGSLIRAPDRTAGRSARWAGSWAASPVEPGLLAQRGFHRATVRDVVRLSIGGNRVRIRLSNAFGTGALTVAEATVGLQSEGAGVRPRSLRRVSFGGARTTTVPRGAQVVSDPVTLRVPAQSDLSVSLYFRGRTGPVTWHPLGTSTTWYAPGGNETDTAAASPYTETAESWFVLDGVDVRSRRQLGAVVTLGDSITDGYGATVDANRRYPDVLARRLLSQPSRRPLGVLNAGISGNRVLTDAGLFGVSAQARFDRDVLAQTGARTVVLLEGINDIGNDAGVDGGPVTAGQLIAGTRNVVRRADAQGLTVVGGTLLPYRGADYWTPRGERIRQRFNCWVRRSDAFDDVVDFAKVTRDPQRPLRLLPRYDLGDHLHPNDAGYAAMGRAVDLDALYGR